MVEDVLNDLRNGMKGSLENLAKELSKRRTGRLRYATKQRLHLCRRVFERRSGCRVHC